LVEAGQEHELAGVLAEFCVGLVNDLFSEGLPIRGAWAFGDYYVESVPGKTWVAGKPLTEAHKLFNRVDMMGCVLAPSAEAFMFKSRILDSSPEGTLGFIKYPVPLNRGGGKQELFMLNHHALYRHYHPGEPEISRQVVMEKFGMHNKQITVDVLSKVNNTLQFLEASKMV
jgi:hypothetical protein